VDQTTAHSGDKWATLSLNMMVCIIIQSIKCY